MTRGLAVAFYALLALGVFAVAWIAWTAAPAAPQPVNATWWLTIIPVGMFAGWSIYRWIKRRTFLTLATVMMTVGALLVLSSRVLALRGLDVIGSVLAGVGLLLATFMALRTPRAVVPPPSDSKYPPNTPNR